jgi:hypothetical protein
VQTCVIARSAPSSKPTTTLMLDPTGGFCRDAAGQPGQALLVRPDGYLGYRGRIDRPGDIAAYLARIFAMRIAAPDASQEM